MEKQVYGGYRAFNFLRNGKLFGADSASSALEIRDRNQFHAAQVRSWIEQAGYAKNNPFDHMTRGENPNQSAPVIFGFSREMLDAVEDRLVNDETNYWQPHTGKAMKILFASLIIGDKIKLRSTSSYEDRAQARHDGLYQKVAKKLGNTPSIARSSYVDPRIFSIYEQSDDINKVYATVKNMKPRKYLSSDERWVLKLLTK